MSVALVTGASGFVGRHTLLPLTTAGFEVHGVGRDGAADTGTAWHVADLLDPASRRSLIAEIKPTHLLHLAWETRHGHYWEAPENLDWVAATLDLVRCFHRAGGTRLVLAGSCAEYDWTPEALGDRRCRERETPCRPATLYGIAKRAAYELTAAFASRVGMSHAGGRLFLAYGPFENESRLVPAVVRSLLEGRRAQLGDPEKHRDFMDVRDAGAAFAALLESSVEGPVNVATGRCSTIGDVARYLGHLVGKADLLDFGALAPRQNDPPHLCADVTRLTEEIGFSLRYTLEQGLADAVTWWRCNLNQGLSDHKSAH